MKLENVVEIIRLILNKNSINLTGQVFHLRFLMLLNKISCIWENEQTPFYYDEKTSLRFKDIQKNKSTRNENLTKGDVVALIGDFNPESICTLLKLIDHGCIVVPLTSETENQHEYFLKESKSSICFIKKIN